MIYELVNFGFDIEQLDSVPVDFLPGLLKLAELGFTPEEAIAEMLAIIRRNV